MRRVVVTGMGIVSPVGNDVNEFWDNLIDGKNGIGPITTFDTENYKAKLAAEVKDFNPRDYMDRSDMLRSDRYVHLGYAAACQAMEESGIEGSVEPEKMGVYFGTGIGGIQTFEKEERNLMEKGPRKVSPFFIPMLIANMASGMIAIKFNCKGAAMPSVTACASGANAIGEAVRAIRHGYLDAAVAGGSEAAISEVGMAGFINMQALSVVEDPNEASLPFDKRRGGFVMGEGGAALILEEYEHAVERGAKIYAEICGYGSTCDAYHITAPREDAEQSSRAIKDALAEAGYQGEGRVYVNAHGTGTHLNDISETLAVKKAFGEEKAKSDVVISSTKSMTGHLLGAAGAAEAIVCIKVLNEGMVPPTINLNEPDPECDLNYTPCKAAKDSIDLAVSNSLGFGGHNACLAFRRI
ncbi:MAG: beta-ketoacyl-[acyl-carrier-protein] synthase II [Clostridiales bacterium]|nr:beta-ketoacyl-[acyl-carrier-protein] synthase II [Clostridiales bacterium]MBR6701094.1 beta-ketoacyl-ACP synthase II [Bacillota bacterium]